MNLMHQRQDVFVPIFDGVAQVKIPGRMFPVEDFYFEDCCSSPNVETNERISEIRSDLWVC